MAQGPWARLPNWGVERTDPISWARRALSALLPDAECGERVFEVVGLAVLAGAHVVDPGSEPDVGSIDGLAVGAKDVEVTFPGVELAGAREVQLALYLPNRSR